MTGTTETTRTVEIIEQAPVPEGMVRLGELLDVVRTHAETNDWCSTAEEYLHRALGLSFVEQPVPTRRAELESFVVTGCDCMSCERGRKQLAELPAEPKAEPWRRFTPEPGTREFVSAAALGRALTKGGRAHGDVEGVPELIADIEQRFGVSPDRGRTWIVTIEVTDLDLDLDRDTATTYAQQTVAAGPRVADALYRRSYRSMSAVLAGDPDAQPAPEAQPVRDERPF